LITNPVDLQGIESKLQSEGYATMLAFYKDLKLMVDNAYTFNMPGSQVGSSWCESCDMVSRLMTFRSTWMLSGLSYVCYKPLLPCWSCIPSRLKQYKPRHDLPSRSK
jgi:thiol-disulfide isomerase/thioredoxin